MVDGEEAMYAVLPARLVHLVVFLLVAVRFMTSVVWNFERVSDKKKARALLHRKDAALLPEVRIFFSQGLSWNGGRGIVGGNPEEYRQWGSSMKLQCMRWFNRRVEDLRESGKLSHIFDQELGRKRAGGAAVADVIADSVIALVHATMFPKISEEVLGKIVRAMLIVRATSIARWEGIRALLCGSLDILRAIELRFEVLPELEELCNSYNEPDEDECRSDLAAMVMASALPGMGNDNRRATVGELLLGTIGNLIVLGCGTVGELANESERDEPNPTGSTGCSSGLALLDASGDAVARIMAANLNFNTLGRQVPTPDGVSTYKVDVVACNAAAISACPSRPAESRSPGDSNRSRRNLYTFGHGIHRCPADILSVFYVEELLSSLRRRYPYGIRLSGKVQVKFDVDLQHCNYDEIHIVEGEAI